MDDLERGLVKVDCVFTLNQLALMACILENSRDENGDLSETESTLLKTIEACESKGVSEVEAAEEAELAELEAYFEDKAND